MIIEHTVETRAKPERIWALWQDVANWNKWDAILAFRGFDWAGDAKKPSA